MESIRGLLPHGPEGASGPTLRRSLLRGVEDDERVGYLFDDGSRRLSPSDPVGPYRTNVHSDFRFLPHVRVYTEIQDALVWSRYRANR